MIQQHYYSRDKRGVFSKTPGFDTIAKSHGLEDRFVRDTLHDLCFYEAPSILAGEQDISKYPAAFFCVNTEEGNMVIGQSSFAGKDYTLQRNRYFTHNYIIPKEERDKYIKNPESMIYAGDFVCNYNIDCGMDIPAVCSLNENRIDDCCSTIQHMFRITGMNKEIFEKLIKSCFDAAKYGTKIYIVTDTDSNSITKIAKGVLKYLYRALPFEVRRKIGFITYMKEPKLKNLINIVFLCKGSIKRLNTEIKSGYVFDLAEKSFYLDGIDEEKHIFLDFIMNNIENNTVLHCFFEKVDKLNLDNSLNIYKQDDILRMIDEEKSKRDESSYRAENIQQKNHEKISKYHIAKEEKQKDESRNYNKNSFVKFISNVWKKICYKTGRKR